MSYYTPGSTGLSIPQNPNGMLCYKAPDHCDQLVMGSGTGGASTKVKSGGASPISNIYASASLPGVAAGGILQSYTVKNIGSVDITFIGSDGNPFPMSPNETQSWNIDGQPSSLGSFTIDATGGTAKVAYTYI
jgi:hypothetical protein